MKILQEVDARKHSKFALVSSMAPDYFFETNPSSNAVTASARGSFKSGISVPEPKREKEEASSLASPLKGIGKEIPKAGEAPQKRRRLQPTVICK